jgi:hypothetical protein
MDVRKKEEMKPPRAHEHVKNQNNEILKINNMDWRVR